MFKSITAFRIQNSWHPSVASVEAALSAKRFAACAATQEATSGWEPPRGEKHGALIEAVGGHWILRLKSEKKMIPGSVITLLASERAEQIEETTGRKVGRKEVKDLKEEIRLDCLPKAFSRFSATHVWIDVEREMLVIDTSSQSKADEVIAHLLRSLDGLVLAPLQTKLSPAVVMADWLNGVEMPATLELDRECELQANDETRGKVRYTRHNLVIDEVRSHIQSGKTPTQVGVTWDGRVSFVLTDELQIKKVKFLDGVIDKADSDTGKDRFDADVAITTGELTRLIPDLAAALGGEECFA